MTKTKLKKHDDNNVKHLSLLILTVNCEIVHDCAGGGNGMHIGTEILNKSSHMSLK